MRTPRASGNSAATGSPSAPYPQPRSRKLRGVPCGRLSRRRIVPPSIRLDENIGSISEFVQEKKSHDSFTLGLGGRYSPREWRDLRAGLDAHYREQYQQFDY